LWIDEEIKLNLVKMIQSQQPQPWQF